MAIIARSISRNGGNTIIGNKKKTSARTCFLLLSHLVLSFIAFQFGLLVGRAGKSTSHMTTTRTGVVQKQQEEQEKVRRLNLQCPPCPKCGEDDDNNNNKDDGNDGDGDGNENDDGDNDGNQNDNNDDGVEVVEGQSFPSRRKAKFTSSTYKGMNSWIAGMGKVNREEFGKYFDIGIPLDPSKDYGRHSNDNVLLLYGSSNSIPSSSKATTTEAADNEDEDIIPYYDSVQTATSKCETVKVILTKPSDRDNVCMAIMGQYESYHIQKFRQFDDNAGDSVHSKYHQYVARGDLNRETHLKKIPPQLATKVTPSNNKETKAKAAEEFFISSLLDYYTKRPTTLKKLQPLAQKAAAASRSYGNGKSVIVMVCNHGQSELLMNFICNAKSRKFDLSSILLFATDTKTCTLVKSLDAGIQVFEVDDAFSQSKLPEQAAKRYGDKTFSQMMLAKIYCVSLVNKLGYNILFQDVDVIWKKQNPLEFFHSPTLMNEQGKGQFDLYFQDDGARSNRYSPYSPNTGFYYVRYNERTAYFLDVFVRMHDTVLTSHSHQESLNSLLSDYASSIGLRIKVYQKDSELGKLFPGGFHYHRRGQTYMRDMVGKDKKENPYIFHMSWTYNKDNKKKFFQQLGEWYIKTECDNDEEGLVDINKISAQACCAIEPIVKCHYRDKASIIPCKDSPPIDKGRPSFW